MPSILNLTGRENRNRWVDPLYREWTLLESLAFRVDIGKENHKASSLLGELSGVSFFWKERPDYFGVSGMTLISQVKVLSRVVTAKCSEPQAVCSNVNRGGSGVANLSSLRTET